VYVCVYVCVCVCVCVCVRERERERERESNTQARESAEIIGRIERYNRVQQSRKRQYTL
jgi:hypothetical protein